MPLLHAFLRMQNKIVLYALHTVMNKFVCCLALLLLTFIPATIAQNEVNYVVYANIVYRFTKYINWPDDKKSGDFVIGVVGNSPLYDELKSYVVNKRVGNQKIILRRFSTSAKAYNCHILFISEDAERNLKKIVSTTEGTPTLLVSEGNELTQKGSCINFNVEDEHLKLEMNKINIEERNLNVASELMSLCVIVK